MRRICLAAALLATAAAPLAAQEPKAPGCEVKAYHAYSECNDKDGMWHVVTDAICADGSGTRVHDVATDQPCKGDKAVKKTPEPKSRFSTDMAGCNSSHVEGEIWTQECVDGTWCTVRYERVVCSDGSIRVHPPRLESTKIPCDHPEPALTFPGVTAVPMPPLDFVDAIAGSAPQKPVARDVGTQRMMIDLMDYTVPGYKSAVMEPLASGASLSTILADAWHALAHAATPSLSRGWSSLTGRDFWIEPGTSTILQGATRAARVHAYLTSLGTSTGEAFGITIANDSATPVRLAGDGVVVEPIKKGADKDERAGLQQALASRRGSLATSKANGYCLEFKLNPPEQGSMFQVVDAATQKQYSAARDILHASRQLQAANQLQPDSDPQDYFHAIRQWAIWADEQHVTTRAQYAQAFVERTKKNVAAVRQQWTKQMEDTLNQLVPHRWDEIVKILRAAGRPIPGA